MTDNTKAYKPRQRKSKDLFSDDLLDQLLDQVKGRDAESLLEESGLVGQLKKQLVERMLSAELNHHLATERASGDEPGNHRNGSSAGIRLIGKPQPPTWLAMLHGFSAAAAVTLLLYTYFTVGLPALACWALLLFLIAAASGAFRNLNFRWKMRPLPMALIVGHAGVAVIGFALLFAATWAAKGLASSKVSAIHFNWRAIAPAPAFSPAAAWARSDRRACRRRAN